MSYNGSGTFVINSTGQPVVTGTVISSTAFNALTADLATGLSTAVTKDGQTTTTARVPFAQGISSTLVTDATSATTGSIITAGGISTQKALWVGTTATIAGILTGAAANFTSITGSTCPVSFASSTAAGIFNSSPQNGSGGYCNTQLGQSLTLLSNTAANAVDSYWVSGAYYNAGFKYQGTGIPSLYSQNAGAHAWGYAPAGTANSAFSFTTLMTLSAAGNLGIGMTPSNILDITQNTSAQSFVMITNPNTGTAASAGFKCKNNSTDSQFGHLSNGYTTNGVLVAGAQYMYNNNAEGTSIVSGAGPVRLAAGSTVEALRIDTSGNLCVGSTSSNPITINTIGMAFVPSAGLRLSTASTGTYMAVTAVSGTIINFYTYNSGAVLGGNISQNAGTTSFNATSDERLKDWQSVVQSDKRQMIEDLWIGDYDKYTSFEKIGTPSRDFGIRSQQAFSVLGNISRISPPEKEDGIWSAPAEPFGFLALWGVKDLYTENEALRARVATLEARLTALETK